MLATKEVPLYGGRDRGIMKYGCSFNTRSHRIITSPLENSQWDSKGCGCTSTFFKANDSWYSYRGRWHGQSRGRGVRDKFRRGGQGSLNR
jgi:hypothetical protein